MGLARSVEKRSVDLLFELPCKRPIQGRFAGLQRLLSSRLLHNPVLSAPAELSACTTSTWRSALKMADVLPPPTRPPPTPRTNADFRALLDTPRANRGGETPSKGQQKPAAQKKRPPRPKPKPETEATDDEPRYRYIMLATCCMVFVRNK